MIQKQSASTERLYYQENKVLIKFQKINLSLHVHPHKK